MSEELLEASYRYVRLPTLATFSKSIEDQINFGINQKFPILAIVDIIQFWQIFNSKLCHVWTIPGFTKIGNYWGS